MLPNTHLKTLIVTVFLVYLFNFVEQKYFNADRWNNKKNLGPCRLSKTNNMKKTLEIFYPNKEQTVYDIAD